MASPEERHECVRIAKADEIFPPLSVMPLLIVTV